MRAGQLDRRITVEYPVTGQDNYGSPTTTWTPLVTSGSPAVAVKFWAQVQDVLPGRSEAVQGGLMVGRSQSRCRMRYRSDITSAMRITVHWDSGDVVYQIVGGPSIIGRKEWIEMVLERVTS